MYKFELHQPRTSPEAARLYADLPSPAYLAGGHTLIPALKLRLSAPSDLIDLSQVEGLRGIEVRGDTLRIGAMEAHAQVAESPIVLKHIPALAMLAGDIGDQMVRNRGTIGGSVANNDPAADYPAAILGLGARVITTERKIDADEFFRGMFETALQPGELILGFELPMPEAAAYIKSPHPTSGYAVAGVFAAKMGSAIRVAVTGAAACVHRVPEVEQRLAEHWSVESLMGWEPDAGALSSDPHAGAEFRAQLLKVTMRKVIAALTEDRRQ